MMISFLHASSIVFCKNVFNSLTDYRPDKMIQIPNIMKILDKNTPSAK